MSHAAERRLLLATNAAILVALGVRPQADRFTWFMENMPVLIAWPILVATRNRFPLSRLAYRLLWLHALILMVGGHYTYANVPAGFWVQRLLSLSRNPYDRLGHFAQGFVPAVLVREYLLRRSPLGRGRLLSVLVVCCCLAGSAAYEFLEWWTAVAKGEAAEAFLGTQGDPWDTQWDMFMALVGASCSILLLGRAHDRSLADVEGIRLHRAPRDGIQMV